MLGRAPEGLLDSYESERRPIAERVVMHTMAQQVLVSPGPEVTALRMLFGELLTDRAALHRIAELIAGSGFAYPHTGPWAPDTTLADGTRLASLTRDGGMLLIDRHGLGAGYAERVRVVADSGPGDSLLLRPDGYLAWTSAQPAAELPAAIERWATGFVPAVRTMGPA